MMITDIIYPAFSGSRRNLLSDLFSFRHRIFNKRLGWEQESAQSLGKDNFDEFNPVYLLARDNDGKVLGTLRLMRTDGPNMLKNEFSYLLQGCSIPSSSAVWEISRFAVEPDIPEEHPQASSSEVCSHLIQSLCEFSQRHRVEYFVAVMGVDTLEFLRGLENLSVQVLGEGVAKDAQQEPLYACRIWLHAQGSEAIQEDCNMEKINQTSPKMNLLVISRLAANPLKKTMFKDMPAASIKTCDADSAADFLLSRTEDFDWVFIDKSEIARLRDYWSRIKNDGKNHQEAGGSMDMAVFEQSGETATGVGANNQRRQEILADLTDGEVILEYRATCRRD
ncbi:MAG: acyl-homoserine-lactone synthase [Gammaproteobacteria bacterium]|jgi:N-acyl-L-homoserine lactone synthetase